MKRRCHQKSLKRRINLCNCHSSQTSLALLVMAKEVLTVECEGQTKLREGKVNRIILDNKETRIGSMKQLLEGVAESILTVDSNKFFAEYTRIRNKVWRYSAGNQMLQHLQAPDSALVASLTAFSNMAKEQGHEAVMVTRRGKKREELVHIVTGAKAVWIWGVRVGKKIEENEQGESESKSYTRFCPMTNFCAEDIRYSDTNEAFVPPTHVIAIDDRNLYEGLIRFAEAENITITESGLHGAAGASYGGRIKLTPVDWQAQVPVLIHELAHELLHHKGEGLPTKIKEAEAEAIVAIILQYYGYDTVPQSAYIRDWQCSPKEVLESMNRIVEAACRIVDFIEETG